MIFTEKNLTRLRAMPKKLAGKKPRGWRVKPGHIQVDLEVRGEGKNRFHVYVRQNSRLSSDFSTGVRWSFDGTSDELLLARYNGSEHVHTNPDGERISYTTHIHRAIAEYLQAGLKADVYAEKTDRYHDIAGAVAALASDFNIEGGINLPPQQMRLVT
jgi:hypothetical protein